MAKSVGVVSRVIGEVFAVAADGSRRLLIEGDRLYAGDHLETGPAGSVAVRLDNGALLTLGRDSSLEMTTELLSHQPPRIDTPDPMPSEAELSDVLRLQHAITRGVDPTVEAEEPAAGGPRPLGGGHSFVLLTEVADRVDPQIGFPTAGFNYLPEPGGREVGGRDTSSRYRDAGSGGPGTELPVQPPTEPGTEPPVQPPTDPGTEPPSQPPTDPGTEPPVQPPTDHPVTLRGLEVEPAELVLNEANLPQGSASDEAALTQRGSFTVVAPDGVYTLSVGGLNVVTAGVVTGVGQSLTSALGNTLTITGYNAQTGEVSYSYTLTGAEQHPDGGGRNDVSEQFAVQASDADGDTASGTLDALIRDDVPTAVSDVNATHATEQHTQLSGNVLSNDIQGADRVSDGKPIVAGTFTGTYGTLHLASDGSYTYTLDVGSQAFKQLPGGGQGSEVFTYTLRDADGDTSSATLTLHIDNLDDPVVLRGLEVQGGELTVYERYLSDGSSPDATALSQAGTFTVSAPDGLQTLTVGGIAVVSGGVAATFPQTVTTGLGNSLTITGYDADSGVVSYRYTLQDNAAHPTGAGANSLQEQFSVIAQDSDGSAATGSLDVNIVDDVPEARADYEQVREGGSVSGNVLLNDTVGADVRGDGQYVVGVRAGTDTSTSATGNVGAQVQGQYGYLTIAADGNATYHANPNSVGAAGGRDVFVYTIRDADGDESTTIVTLDVKDSGLVACQDWDVKVYEKALDLNKDGNDLAPGTVVGSDPGARSETGTGTLVGAVSGGSGELTYSLVGSSAGQYGQIQVHADGTYTYTLTSAPKTPGNPNNGADTQTETFTYQATDANGNTVQSSIVIRIVDDVPRAHCDYEQVREGSSVSGNVLLNDTIGADTRADGQYVVGVRAGNDTSTSATGNVGAQVQGQYGYLTIAADGNATYHANPNSVGAAGGRDVFVYTIRDADGDESTTTVTLDVKDSGLVACQDWDVKVYEKALDLNKDGNDLAPGTVVGSDPGARSETGTGTLVGAVSGGSGELTYSLVGSSAGQYGQIQVHADGTYTYTLTSAPKTPGNPNNGADTQTETFTYQTTDANGNTVQSSIVIRIVDDVPRAHCDYEQVREGSSVSGNVLLNDTIGADIRADGQYVVGVRAGTDTSTSATGNVGAQVQGQYGYLTIAADGNATYHANPNSVGAAGGRDVFVYTIRDADGDESTTTVTLDVKDSGLVACQDWDVKVYEKALDLNKDGNDLAPGTVVGSDPGARSETGTGTLVGAVSGGSGELTYSLVGSSAGQYGQIQVHADGTYTYTLTSAPKTPGNPNNGADTQTETFTYQATDANGNTVQSSIIIRIVDDVPRAHCDYEQVREGSSVSGNVLLNDTIGADIRADGQYVIGVRAGNDTSTSATGNVGAQVQGQYGYLTIAADGNATYHANPNSVGAAGGRDVFVYTIRDADGDESTTTVTLDIKDSSPTPCTPWYGKSSISNFERPDLAKALARSDFVNTTGNLGAVLVVAGLSSPAEAHSSLTQQHFTLALQQGERLTVQQVMTEGGLSLAWQDAAGRAHGVAENGQFTVPHDGLYSLHVSYAPNSDVTAMQGTPLSLVIDPAHATVEVHQALITPAAQPDASFFSGAVTAHAPHTEPHHASAGETLIATDGNVLLHGDSDDHPLDAGTASYAASSHGVVVDLQETGAHAASGASIETPYGIENLIGSDYDDQLFGNAQNNVLVGGLGNDLLSGGGGRDTFIWGQGEHGHDTVTDFKPGQDHLDLSQLLQGEGEGATSLEAYLHFKVSGEGASTATLLQVTSSNSAAPSQSIELAGVDLAQHYGIATGAGGLIASGHDTTALINAMLGDQSLRVDNV